MSAPVPQQIGTADGVNVEFEKDENNKLQPVQPVQLKGPEKCIFNLPCIGGCCAPTVNPDPTCAKHGSNEFTIPASGIYIKAAPLCEYSPCCICCGRLGFPVFARNRSNFMCFAFIVSFAGWILTAFSALALSTSPDVLPRSHWARGELYVVASGETVMQVFIGVQARVEQLDCDAALNTTACMEMVPHAPGFFRSHDNVYRRSTNWEDDAKCGAPPPVNVSPEAARALGTLGTAICGECKTSAMASVQLLIVALITQIPQMATDLQRRTTFGDVNCQATLGAITSVLGCLSTLGALSSFMSSCFSGLPEEVDGVDAVKIRWSGGRAFICLWVATCLKLFDAAIHVLTPTPKGRWQKPQADVENLEQFLMLGVIDAE